MKRFILSTLIAFIVIAGIMYLLMSPMKGLIDTCDDLDWDGTEIIAYREVFTGEEVKLNCTKDEFGEAASKVIKAMWFWEGSA